MIRLFDRDVTKFKIIFLIIFGLLLIAFALYVKSVLEDLELLDAETNIPVRASVNVPKAMAIPESTPSFSDTSFSGK